MKRLSLVAGLLCLLFLVLLPAAAQASSTKAFDKALDKVFAQGYPQTIDQHLFTMPGTNPTLGFAWAGTWADNARANYLAEQMRRLGLKNVHLERVPVDVFTFKSATVTVGSKEFVASTFAGVEPTAAKGLTAPIVYVHDGFPWDYDALTAAGISVQGKLVLADANYNNFWANYVSAEATAHGAIGVVMTYGPDSYPYYSFAPDALGSFDGCWDLRYKPFVYISKQDGDWLKTQLDANGTGPQTTMTLIEKVRMAQAGGHGYNVFGDLPGRIKDGTFILFAAHHDIHFHAGTDDTACVANDLAIAKAMVKSGYRPAHTVRFMFDTGEEFGYTNAYYDWCIGAWYSITHTHRDWAGKIRLFLNSDYFSGQAPLALSTTADLAPALNAELAADSALLPYGANVGTAQNTWTDGWTFQAAGVPTVAFSATPPNRDNGTYHTQYMRPSQVDWSYVDQIAKVMFRVAQDSQTGLLPVDLKARADELAATVVSADLTSAGAKVKTVTHLENAITVFQKAAAGYEARKATIPMWHNVKLNRALLRIEKTIDSSFTALNVWDMTIYPHQQVLNDVASLNQAIADLKLPTPDTADAQTALSNVALTLVGMALDHSMYLVELRHHDPQYSRVTWGGQGHLARYLDVMPQYNAIGAGTWGATTIAQLTKMRDCELRDLNERLQTMTAVLQHLTPQVNALR